MKCTLQFTVLLICTLGLAACHTSNTKQDSYDDRPYQRKIYLTEQEYLDYGYWLLSVYLL